jgi:hypothetical protein
MRSGRHSVPFAVWHRVKRRPTRHRPRFPPPHHPHGPDVGRDGYTGSCPSCVCVSTARRIADERRCPLPAAAACSACPCFMGSCRDLRGSCVRATAMGTGTAADKQGFLTASTQDPRTPHNVTGRGYSPFLPGARSAITVIAAHAAAVIDPRSCRALRGKPVLADRPPPHSQARRPNHRHLAAGGLSR